MLECKTCEKRKWLHLFDISHKHKFSSYDSWMWISLSWGLTVILPSKKCPRHFFTWPLPAVCGWSLPAEWHGDLWFVTLSKTEGNVQNSQAFLFLGWKMPCHFLGVYGQLKLILKCTSKVYFVLFFWLRGNFFSRCIPNSWSSKGHYSFMDGCLYVVLHKNNIAFFISM